LIFFGPGFVWPALPISCFVEACRKTDFYE